MNKPDNRFQIFGFKIGRSKEEETPDTQQSFVSPTNEDGALTVASSAFFGTYVDLDTTAKNDNELITRYREMAMQPEIESAIDNIVNEAITFDEDGENVHLILDNLPVQDNIKQAIQFEFRTVKRLLNYGNMAYEIFRRFYIDGRLRYHIIVDEANPQAGIRELRYIDPRKIRKIREVKKEITAGVDLVDDVQEYYIYSEKNIGGLQNSLGPVGVKITTDSIIDVNSGIMDSRRQMVLSYLHSCIKPLNCLRMIEDAVVIYTVGRAPERRIFYIDMSSLPKGKQQQYLEEMAAKYRNKISFNVSDGQVMTDRKHNSILEDFFIPRLDGNKTTEITTLPSSGQLLNNDLITYFEQKLYKALHVPVSRLNPQEGFSFGRSSEITRDEVNFAAFVDRIRHKFTEVFDQALRVQCVLKGICTSEEWEILKEDLYFDFIKDNNYKELKSIELLQNRLGAINQVDPYVGKYFSRLWVQKHVLRLSDEEIQEMEQQIEMEFEQEMQKEMMHQAMMNQAMGGEVPPQEKKDGAKSKKDS